MAQYFTVRLPSCYQCTPWPPNYFAKCETLFPGLESPILDALENESGEHHWTHEATTPFGIVGGCGLRGEDFIEGFTLLFETRDLFTDSNQQVAIETELRLVGNRAEVFQLRPVGDRAIDFSAGRG